MSYLTKLQFLVMVMAFLISFAGFSESSAEEPAGFAVVELFTSEGCSSCPPGEAALSNIRSWALDENSNVYTIAWHVDYWDSLGWPDPFGTGVATERQRWYARLLNSSRYTPQVIVNGRYIADYAGDSSEIRKIVSQKMESTGGISLESHIADYRSDGLIVNFSLEDRDRYDVEAVLVEENLISTPTAGENRNRELHHVSTVRAAGRAESNSYSIELSVADGVNGANASVIVLVRSVGEAEIIGAMRLDLPTALVGSVRGSVLDSDGVPITDSVLQFCTELLCIPVVTDESGEFLISDLAPGPYLVKTGEASIPIEVTVEAGAVQVLDVVIN